MENVAMKIFKKCSYPYTKAIFALYLASFCTYSYSQPNTPTEIPSPNASDLGRYGEINVSYCNGTISPTIPLFEYEQNGVKLDISLCYESSGVKVNNLPGWTGHNWTLNAGGAITRTVNGRADELRKPSYYDTVRRKWLPYFEVYNTGWNARENYWNHCDIEADMFHFNFMGKTGTFMFGDDGQWHVKSDCNIDVIFDINDENNYIAPFINTYPMNAQNGPWQPKTIKGFTLIDENGIKYDFGYLGNYYPGYPNGQTNAIEYSMSMSAMSHDSKHADWIACTWYLTRIEDRFGNILFTFDYERDYYIINIFNNLSVFDSTSVEWEALSPEQQETLSAGARLDTSPVVHDDRNLIDYTFKTDYKNDYFPYSGSVIAPVYLKNINTMDGVNIDFSRIDLDIPTDTLYASLYNNNEERPMLSTAYQDCYYLQDQKFMAYQKATEGEVLYNDPLKAMGLKLLSSIHVYSINTDSTTYKEGLSINLDYNTTGKVHLTGISFSSYDFETFYDSWLDDSWPTIWSETAFNKNYLWDDKPSIMKYTLTYNDYDKVPYDYLTTATDAWGYYNGIGYNSTYMHDIGLGRNWDAFAQKKTVNTETSQYGSLKEIIYPTGGKTVFEFENNNYSLCLDSTRQELIPMNGVCGGLRIKRITNVESNGDILSDRHFFYTKPGTNVSCGQLVSQPHFSYYYKTGNYHSRLFNSQSVMPMVNSFGNHICYPFVKEVHADGSSSLYQFSSYAEVKDDIPCMFLGYNGMNVVGINNRDHMRGKLLMQKFFDNNNQLVRVDSCFYNTPGPNDYILNAKYYRHSIFGLYAMQGGQVNYYYPKHYLTSKSSTFYKNGEYLYHDDYKYEYCDCDLSMQTKGYSHTGRICKLLSETVSRDSCSLKCTYSYPFNCASFPFSNELSNNAYFNPIIEKKNYRNNALIERFCTEYDIFPNSYICPKYDKKETDTGISTETTYLSYDSRGWLTQFRDKTSNVQIIWNSWDSMNKIESVIRGNTIAEPTYDSDEFGLYNSESLSVYNSLRRSNHGSLITSYTYTPLGKIQTVTNPNGETLHYNYDGMGRLISISDLNGNVIKSFEYNYVIY